MVKFLLESGAKINPEQPADPVDTPPWNLSPLWPTPMQIAVGLDHLYGDGLYWKPKPEMINFLAAKGADLNKKGNFDCSTPLHIAVERGDLDTVKLLISLGADPSIRTGRQNDQTLLSVAQEKKHDDIVAYLNSL